MISECDMVSNARQKSMLAMPMEWRSGRESDQLPVGFVSDAGHHPHLRIQMLSS